MGGGRVAGGARQRVLGDEGGGNQEPGSPSWPVVLWTFVPGLPLPVQWYNQRVRLALEIECQYHPESRPVLTLGTHLTNVGRMNADMLVGSEGEEAVMLSLTPV